MNRKFHNLNIIFFLISLVAIWALLQFAFPKESNVRPSTISEVATQVKEGKIEQIVVKGNRVRAKTKDGSVLQTFKESGSSLVDYGISPESVSLEIENPEKGALVPNIISFVLPFLVIGIFIWFMVRSAQGANIRAMSFGKSQARLTLPGQRKVTFSDVAGNEEAKHELQEVVEFLRYPDKFKRLGAEIPKGVLLIGAPGTGKTLMAKAVAGEAGVPFFSISASEFVEMFVGVGAARVRDLFNKAKRSAPAILFVDELDAIGRMRGSGLGGSHDEREQTLNQILVEMDGFETDARVVVMAATNRPDVLDPALLRPGRFDRRVTIDLPDKKAREDILKIHARKKPVGKSVSWGQIASNTAGFSGADLRNVVNESAILAARFNHKEITSADVESAIEKVLLGPEKKSRILSEHEKKVTAFHEAGHALVARVLPNTDPVQKVSIVSRGQALGFTWTRPEQDSHLVSKSKFQDELAQLLGGRVAEEIVFKEVTTGAENDLRRATKIARNMVTVYGMSEKLGPITFGEREELVFLGRELAEHKTYSDYLAQLIDGEVSQFVKQAHGRAKQVLLKHKGVLEKIAKELINVETLDARAFERFFKDLRLAPKYLKV